MWWAILFIVCLQFHTREELIQERHHDGKQQRTHQHYSLFTAHTQPIAVIVNRQLLSVKTQKNTPVRELRESSRSSSQNGSYESDAGEESITQHAHYFYCFARLPLDSLNAASHKGIRNKYLPSTLPGSL
jgi:hypothetical protein